LKEPVKDSDTDNLDAGWDEAPVVAPARTQVSSTPPQGLDDVDAGWDASPPVAPPLAAEAPRAKDGARGTSPVRPSVDAPLAGAAARKSEAFVVRKQEVLRAPAPAVAKGGGTRPERLGKRERRAFERQKRAESDKRRAERKAEEKRARKAAARHSAERREAERREARERSEKTRRREPAEPARPASKRRSESVRPGEERPSEARPEAAARSRRRFVMPNGGWIVLVIAFITLGTAWFAFSR
jgi:hypothetical protein